MAKKEIKGRVCLSDGTSKMICMLPDQLYQQMVSQAMIFADSCRLTEVRNFANLTSGYSMLASKEVRQSKEKCKFTNYSEVDMLDLLG